jgi:hypothetical protein
MANPISNKLIRPISVYSVFDWVAFDFFLLMENNFPNQMKMETLIGCSSLLLLQYEMILLSLLKRIRNQN